MKKTFLLFLLIPLLGCSQNYVDILKIGYSQNFNNTFEGTDQSTTIKSINIDATYPVVLDKNNALITGLIYSRNNLEIFPEPDFNLIDIDPDTFPRNYENVSLQASMLKLGIATTFNETWSGTFVFLPKVASDYRNISSADFFLGGFASLKYKKHERLIYRVGFFAQDQVYGWFTTPILGIYYLSQNQKFEMDVSFPIAGDINYKLGNKFSVGFDYFGIGQTFDIHQENTEAYYVDYGVLEFTGYLQYGLLDNSVLLRTKVGYADVDVEAYNKSEKLDLRISAFDIGSRNDPQNPEVSSGLFAKAELIYRFNIANKKGG